MQAHPSTQIANVFLDLAQERGVALTPMQLIKLVYIAHGWMLALHSRPLIKDEVQAWKFGPVIPELYRHVAKFRADPVQGRLPEPAAAVIDEDELDIITQVFDLYGGKSAGALSSLTHQSGTPWHRTWEPNGWATPIPNAVIREHYEGLVKRFGAAQ